MPGQDSTCTVTLQTSPLSPEEMGKFVSNTTLLFPEPIRDSGARRLLPDDML